MLSLTFSVIGSIISTAQNRRQMVMDEWLRGITVITFTPDKVTPSKLPYILCSCC